MIQFGGVEEFLSHTVCLCGDKYPLHPTFVLFHQIHQSSDFSAEKITPRLGSTKMAARLWPQMTPFLSPPNNHKGVV